MSDKINRVVLAYLGRARHQRDPEMAAARPINCEVVTFTADLGQGEELEPARRKAEAARRQARAYLHRGPARGVRPRNYVFPMMRANALYEGLYLLGTSIARPLIAKKSDRDRAG
jgi:argininosuccinate synthase